MTNTGVGDKPGPAPRFDLGDRVITTRPLGRLWRTRVPRGTRGVVIGRSGRHHYTVAFTDGSRETAPEHALAESPPSSG